MTPLQNNELSSLTWLHADSSLQAFSSSIIIDGSTITVVPFSHFLGFLLFELFLAGGSGGVASSVPGLQMGGERNTVQSAQTRWDP